MSGHIKSVSCMKKFIISFFVFLTCLSGSSLAVVELNEFKSEEMRVRYTALIEELRCPKCQNQNLAGSDSVVAVDLRREVFLMLEEGYSDKEIRNFMHERYGDFILYNPPIAGKTMLVWVLPILFFICGLFVAFYIIRNATRNAKIEKAGSGFDSSSDEDLDELDFSPEEKPKVSSEANPNPSTSNTSDQSAESNN